jgi:hypothetical protein
MDMSRELLLQRLKSAGLSLTEASKKIGRNASYLQQFVTRGTPVQLRARERKQLALLLGVDEDALREDPVTQWSLHGGLDDPAFRKDDHTVQNKAPMPLPQRQNNSIDSPRSITLLSRDLPVYGFVSQNSDGHFVVTDQPVDFMPRPDFLANNKSAYAQIVPDDRMSPEIRAGDTIVLNPLLPCRDGDTCFFRKGRIGNDGIFASLVSSNPKSWNVFQHVAPKKIIELDKTDYPVADPAAAKFYR